MPSSLWLFSFIPSSHRSLSCRCCLLLSAAKTIYFHRDSFFFFLPPDYKISPDCLIIIILYYILLFCCCCCSSIVDHNPSHTIHQGCCCCFRLLYYLLLCSGIPTIYRVSPSHFIGGTNSQGCLRLDLPLVAETVCSRDLSLLTFKLFRLQNVFVLVFLLWIAPNVKYFICYSSRTTTTTKASTIFFFLDNHPYNLTVKLP